MTTAQLYAQLYPTVRESVSQTKGVKKFLIYPFLPILLRIFIEVLAATLSPQWSVILSFFESLFDYIPANVLSDESKTIVRDFLALVETNKTDMLPEVQTALAQAPTVIPKGEGWPS